MFKEAFVNKTENSGIHLIRSTVAGTVSFFLDFLTLILLVEIINLHYITAGIVGFTAGTSLNYFLSTKWVFKSRRVSSRLLEYLIFICLGLLGGGLNMLLLWLFTARAGIYYMISRIMAAMLGFIFNFITRKVILFSKKRK